MFEEQVLDNIRNGNWTTAIRACAAKKEVDYEIIFSNYADYGLDETDMAYLVTCIIKELRKCSGL